MRTGIKAGKSDPEMVLPVYHASEKSLGSNKLHRLWSRIQYRRKSRNAPTASEILLYTLVVLSLIRFILVPLMVSVPDNHDYQDTTLSNSIVTEKWGPRVNIYDFTMQPVELEKPNKRLLICMPLRNAESIIEEVFRQLYALTYEHSLIDVAFMVGDSTDETFEELSKLSSKLQKSELHPFHRIDIFQKEFGAVIGQNVDERHGVAVQGVRRKLMGRARNWLLSVSLKPYHSYVYWRDADIVDSPVSIIEDLMKFDKDVIVPNIWRPLPKYMGGEQPYDLNSWAESEEAVRLASTLDEDDVIVEGYAEYPTWRPHLAYLRKEGQDPNTLMSLDGIGGVSILSKARVFRAGANFPGFAFLNHAETEGFGKMCKKMGFGVFGLPNYVIWHAYEPSDEDIKRNAERKAAGLPVD